MSCMTVGEEVGICIDHEAVPAPPTKVGKRFAEDDVSTVAPSQRVECLDSPRSPLDSKEVVTLTSKSTVKTHALVPPSTPRRNGSPFPTTPPAAPKGEPMPLLMRALQANSTTLVLEAIEVEPDVARYPFWDHEVEPPLCFAVRHNCKADIIKLLLSHGAELDAKDRQGRSPGKILTSMRMAMNASTSSMDLGAIEKLLGVPAFEPRNDAKTIWRDPVDMCGLMDWRVFDFDISKGDLTTSLKDHGVEALTAAWLGA